MYDVHEPRVLIVGGGLVGLTAALFLRYHGVPSLLVERRATTSPQPKARRINIRTMELFDQIGIGETVLDAARDLSAHQAMAAGPTLARATRLPFTLPGGMPDWAAITPSTACLCAQDLLEPTLRTLATERGCDIRFGVECTEFTQDTTGVTATLRSADGDPRRMRVSYLIAADGAASPIRERLGITRSGRGTLGRAVNVYFHAELSNLVRGREFNLCQIENDRAPGAFMSVDGARRWIFSTSHDIDRPVRDWPRALRIAIGEPDVDLEVVSVLPWEPGMFVADRYRDGRIFLAGDAAHVMPPYAAAGANTGIHDVHNLAWKLAAVLRGAAGPGLLDTYHTERHPVGWFTADQSSVRTADLRTLAHRSTDGTPLADPIAMILGQRYPSGAFIDDDSPHTLTHLDLTGQPGTRVPHLPLPDGRSTLDLPGPGFALLTGPQADHWQLSKRLPDALRETGCAATPPDASSTERRADHRIPPRPRTYVHTLDEKWCVAAGITRSGALLLRPDQIVAWRTPTAPADPATALDSALDRILAEPQKR
ncbi:FAD-dependent monooxygenase [Nocardia sp. CA2R105]|nr:FAD-dependent monooxygenase [Nocardia coffeae]